jgi:hypothetical protein
MSVWYLIAGLLFSTVTAVGTATAQATPAVSSPPDSLHDTALPAPESPVAEQKPGPNSDSSGAELPDAPSSTIDQQQDVVAVGKASLKAHGRDQKPCDLIHAFGMIYFDPTKTDDPRPRCSELVYPYQRFLSTNVAIPLTWKQKGYLAVHFSSDPATIGIISGISAISIAADPHSAYGPGLEGFGKLAGISLLQNATAEFFGVFAIPSIMHQDPRYYRQPNKPFGKRILYSITRSYVSRADDGHTIPNYGVLGVYPIIAELGNLYVPGLETDGVSTTKRILTGYALDPVNNLVNEFLPDMAKHVHVRVIFMQQILNNIAASGNGVM